MHEDKAGTEISKWYIPGDLIKYNEPIEKALKRIVKEKTDLNVELINKSLMDSFVSLYENRLRTPHYYDTALSFLCKFVGGKYSPGPMIKAVNTFTVDEIINLNTGADHKNMLLDGIVKLRKMGQL